MASESNDKVIEILRSHVKKFYENREFDEQWRNLPAIPGKTEILPPTKTNAQLYNVPEAWNEYQQEHFYDPRIPKNIVDSPWPSKEAYIGAHYQILREDAIAGLRKAVHTYRLRPVMDENNDVCIYTNVIFSIDGS